MENNYTIYSKKGCSYCLKIEQVLKLLKLNYKIYKLGEDFTVHEFCDRFGNNASFPKVVLNDKKIIGGCSETLLHLRKDGLI